MSSDLEKFLQQAAERLAQKTAGSNRAGRPPAGQPQPAPGRPQSGRPTPPRDNRRAPVVEIIEAEVLESEERRARALRQAGSDPLSTIDTRPELAQSINQADERMGEHVQHVFGHELSHLATTKTVSLMGASQANQTDQVTEVISRQQYKSPLVEMLRNPETLKAAFIVGEIFRRPIT